ncbi:V/A-type H+-transporting ATPase subunit E [[Clostridium] aminophilum]|uniref:V/A-type H+-transporting ATPase subunit E n=1 Tax=[Clostridium] aminophilum TaxID=1526 RepID=A0A1I0C5P3_9FIRM|nr:V-type ATP synthase subunit E [[Clostridium] aminophilum]SET14412.1 V/A-type H+-transporting ATPase subunit E [[Clostridium] aminophilum]
MAGIEKIRERILLEAKEEAEQKIAAAEKGAAETVSLAEEEAKKEIADAKAHAETKAEGERQRAISGADMKRRTARLTARQNAITEVLEAAKKELADMAPDRYYPFLLKLLAKNASGREGKFLLSAKDYENMPADFPAQVSELAGKAGGKLTVEQSDKAVGGGFVLDYDGMEENCTLRTIFETRRDELSDCVRRILFQ